MSWSMLQELFASFAEAAMKLAYSESPGTDVSAGT